LFNISISHQLGIATLSTNLQMEHIAKLTKPMLPPSSSSPWLAAFNSCSADNTFMKTNAHGVAPGEAFCRVTMIPIEAVCGSAGGRESVPDQ